MDDGYKLYNEVPTVADYMRLRASAGMSPRSHEGALAGLPNTYFAAVIRIEGQVVGMGRVIGDGGLFFQIVDIAVDPIHQGRGLGKAIVGSLVEHLKLTAPARAYVSLIADGEAHRLYEQFGFAPTAPRSIGMSFTLGPGSE